MSIAALDQQTAKYLTTAQVITSVSSAIKELVENALDAGATNIEIKLEDNGSTLFEVSDNGKGIAKADTAYMALQSYTSKIKDFADLERTTTYGFRGEALASMCRVADVTIITKTEEDEAAKSYKMNHNGNIETYELCHRSVGTTVQVRSLFKDIPVRRQILTDPKRSGRDVKSVESLLRSFAICNPRVGIKCRANGKNILAKPSTETLRDSLMYLFGKRLISEVEFIDKQTPEVDLCLVVPAGNASDLSQLCQGGQHVFVNRRPVRYAEIEKVANNRLAEHFGDKIPSRKKLAFFAILDVPPADVDVNLMPNKTAVLLTNLAKIIETLDRVLVEFYGIVETPPVILPDEPATGNDSTKEFHDYTTSENPATSESVAPPSSKKRKLEDKTVKTGDGSAVKKAAVTGPTKAAKDGRTSKKLFEIPANEGNHRPDSEATTTIETISQLPMVDLGEDYTTQEILEILHRDGRENGITLQNSMKDSSTSSDAKPEAPNALTEEAWSKGQVPINLQGGTDVKIYNSALASASDESEAAKLDTKTTGCKGFSRFSTETRPAIIRENPEINFVEAAKLLTKRWKELTPEERGYYRDIAASDAAQSSNNNGTIVHSKKSPKQRISPEEAKARRNRFLRMFDNSKNSKSTANKENLKMRTIIPLPIDLDALTRSFAARKSNAARKNKSIVLGNLNDDVWLVRTGFQIWALSAARSFDTTKIVSSENAENSRETIELQISDLLRNEENMSLLHPIFELA